jgi:hypothetical protein
MTQVNWMNKMPMNTMCRKFGKFGRENARAMSIVNTSLVGEIHVMAVMQKRRRDTTTKRVASFSVFRFRRVRGFVVVRRFRSMRKGARNFWRVVRCVEGGGGVGRGSGSWNGGGWLLCRWRVDKAIDTGRAGSDVILSICPIEGGRSGSASGMGNGDSPRASKVSLSSTWATRASLDVISFGDLDPDPSSSARSKPLSPSAMSVRTTKATGPLN